MVNSDPAVRIVQEINSCLVESKPIFKTNRPTPICNVPAMSFSRMPRDESNLIFEEKGKIEFEILQPLAAKWIRPHTGVQEFINCYIRYCLWLAEVSP